MLSFQFFFSHLLSFYSNYQHSPNYENVTDQLRVLKDENGRLFKLLSEKDFEIKHLKKKREEERLALAGIIPHFNSYRTLMYSDIYL